jgi:hypothetical protein
MERRMDAGPLRQDSRASLLADVVVPQIRRALALIDRNPASPTYGCADRAYWYYRTLTNFPGATWQQLMLALACVYRTDHPANPHHGDPETAALVSGLLLFWARSSHADGSFDEWYLNERSYCPTAITAAGAALTLHLMGEALPGAARAEGLAALERAGRWLEPRYNDEVMNQNLAAAVALQGLASLMPGARWESVAKAKLERVGREQTREGWFPEYGGLDLGYSSLALDLLAACRMLGAEAIVDDMARRLARFLVDVRGSGAAIPGRLGSRGTSHGFPFGALYFAERDPAAARLAGKLLAGIAQRRIALPDAVDDRYFAYFYLPQFALAFWRAVAVPDAVEAVADPTGTTDLQESGVVVVRRSAWSATVSRRLGGALALETQDRTLFYHLGYEVTLEDDRRYSSAVWTMDTAASREEGGLIVAETSFRAVSGGLPLRRLMVPFQAVLYLLCSSWLAGAFQALIKRRMITPHAYLPLTLTRRVEVAAGAVSVADTLVPQSLPGRLRSIQVASGISMHSPSSRQDPGLSVAVDTQVFEQVLERLNRGIPVTLHWTWTAATGSTGFELTEATG